MNSKAGKSVEVTTASAEVTTASAEVTTTSVGVRTASAEVIRDRLGRGKQLFARTEI